ncbi:Maf family protein [Roseateles sp.]|jgi:septum formation protein|uniref:Maf family protein n=1 Tax=Roseateles sp. TaxID=1971397 RepID=UPI0037C99ACB
MLPTAKAPQPLILASTSPYRRELLSRLRIPFEVCPPDVDETGLPDESPREMAIRLALAKAQAVASRFPHALVIGSDQVADLAGQAIGKPGSRDRARAQLESMSGREVCFHTALAVVSQASSVVRQDLAQVRVRFRTLSREEIEAYLDAEPAYDCAGSAKAEGLGIALLDSIESDDPTALIGLPLMRTCSLLRSAGLQIPALEKQA